MFATSRVVSVSRLLNVRLQSVNALPAAGAFWKVLPCIDTQRISLEARTQPLLRIPLVIFSIRTIHRTLRRART